MTVGSSLLLETSSFLTSSRRAKGQPPTFVLLKICVLLDTRMMRLNTTCPAFCDTEYVGHFSVICTRLHILLAQNFCVCFITCFIACFIACFITYFITYFIAFYLRCNSRADTVTCKPCNRKRLARSILVATERCWPPVQPTAIVT